MGLCLYQGRAGWRTRFTGYLQDNLFFRTMKIIFYDGLCPMCNGWVRFILRWDKRKSFHFASLQSETAGKLLSPVFPGYLEENTIILLESENVYIRSEATLRISQRLAFPVCLFQAGWIIPRVLRDSLYRMVAGRRYRYGKRYDVCPLPPEPWRERFL